MEHMQVLRAVVASPGDVQPERNTVEEVAAELNRSVAEAHGLHLKILRWETDTHPGFHIEGPQGLIDSILHIEDCDLLIGIFWKRFGTPVSDAKSGAEHEIRKAYEAWKLNDRPQIMVYFNKKAYSPKTKEEIDQWSQVLEFKRNFPKEGLWWDYNGKTQFEKLIRQHLTQFIIQRMQPSGESLSLTDSSTTQPSKADTIVTRTIIVPPPTTDPNTIQQREQAVKEVYDKLTQPNITGLVLTGIGGLGKSTLAALVYRYEEDQRQAGKEPFTAQALWLRIDDAVTMTDIGETICKELSKPIQDFARLDPQSQAVALFNALNTTDKPRLIVLDQFENLLDWQTGRALANRPGIGEWLDILNSEQCKCRILLTSRLRPQGTHISPQAHLQEYPVSRLSIPEGIDLLRKQGVTHAQGTDAELGIAVERCSGHALSLTLLATILHDHNLSLATLFKDPTYEQFWTGDIASNLLDYVYKQQLNETQRKLLLAFSVYREAVPLTTAEAIFDFNTPTLKSQASSALRALLAQHLLQASGDGRYQLHAIVADYAQNHFNESDEQANQQDLKAAHVRAAQYYIQQAVSSCPPREKRRAIKDVLPLIEAVWQYCQAEQWQEAYNLMKKEGIFEGLHLWGGDAILLELYELLLPVEKWHPERSQEATIYNDLGEAHNALGKSEEALKYYNQALHIRKEIGDHSGEGETLSDLGLVYYALGQEQQALKYFEQALSILREIGDRRKQAIALSNLAGVYSELGQEQQALKYSEQALSIWREVGEPAGEGAILNNLAGIYSELGQKQEALKYFEQALSISQELGARYWEGLALGNIGILYFEQKRYDVALACWLLARIIFEEILSPDHDLVQQAIDILRSEVGEKQFTTLLATVEPQVSQIVEQALREGL